MPEKRLEYLESLTKNVAISGLGVGDANLKKSTEARICMDVGRALMEGCFRYGLGGVMAFTGTHYVRLTDIEIDRLIKKVLMMAKAGDIYTVNSIAKIKQHIILVLMDKPYEPKKNLVSFQNVVLDLDTMRTYKHDETYETNIYLDFDYNPHYQCPTFDKFLFEVLPNGDSIRVLQEFCGAMFVDRKKYKIENICFLLGTGRNGKGVFTHALQTVLGTENYTAYDVQTLVNKETSIADADGKLANICSDQGKIDISGGALKTFVSGEPMSARWLYQNPFKANNLPLIMVAANEMPPTTDHTFGHHRRPLPIPFNITIDEKAVDTNLSYKIEAEVSGIFNWIVEGRQRFLANGGRFSESEEIEEAKSRTRMESNSVLQFLYEKGYFPKPMPRTNEEFKLVDDFFREYRTWGHESEKRALFEKMNFTKMLKAENFQHKHSRSGNGYYVYVPEYGLSVEEILKLDKKEKTEEIELIEEKEEKMKMEDFWDSIDAQANIPF
jgi:P4 family phage/plasmid primase-like protien